MEKIILIDKHDTQIGMEDKMEAHKQGKLHRAFSIFIFNNKKELLLQQRSEFKPIGPYLWSNTCCSHPRPNKDILKEAERRLKEEMGIKCVLREISTAKYKVRYGLFFEHEITHIFIGKTEQNSVPNRKEALNWKKVSLSKIKEDVSKNPEKYTLWLKIILDQNGDQIAKNI